MYTILHHPNMTQTKQQALSKLGFISCVNVEDGGDDLQTWNRLPVENISLGS